MKCFPKVKIGNRYFPSETMFKLKPVNVVHGNVEMGNTFVGVFGFGSISSIFPNCSIS